MLPLTTRGPIGRPTLESYGDWLFEAHGIDLTRHEANYVAVTEAALHQIRTSSPWSDIVAELNNINDRYKISKGDDLIESTNVQLQTKTFESFINKSFRKNIVLNNNFPNEPVGGWVLPPQWFTVVGDIIRTTIVVRYLDGVEFLSSELQAILTKLQVPTEFDFESRIEGYYAGHLRFFRDAEVPTFDWRLDRLTFQVEIQVTTHVKEAVKAILHPLYVQARVGLGSPAEKDWRWDFASNEFVASNLGHIVHYVEGMIVRIRDEQRKSAT